MYAKRQETLSDFIKIPFSLFGIVGIRIVQWESDDLNDKRHLKQLLLLMANITFNLSCMAGFLYYGQLETAIDVTALAVYWAFSFNSFAKGITVWLGRGNLEFVFKKMLKNFPSTHAERNEYEVDAYLLTIHRYNKYLTIYHFATTSMFNLFPVVQSLIEYLWQLGETDIFDYRFPYMMSYPFNEKRPFAYMIAYCLQCLAAYMLSCLFLGSDLLLITAVHLINMNFKYLSKKIVEFDPSGSDKDIQDMGRLLKYHNDILNYSDKIGETFSFSILLNYVASCLIICLIGFQIVAGTEFFSLIKFFSFLIATLVHVYMISLFGTEMIHLSVGISDAFCQHRWYLANAKYRRLFPLPIARSQRPAHLTAFKFFNISMESFKTLMTTSYQFFTLIRTRLAEE